jgi:NADH dehydrogenase
MRVAITGGTGFVGAHVAERLRASGHETVVLSRRTGHGLGAPGSSGSHGLAEALRGCDAVVHCAGINRELGAQTYEAVHVRGTAAVIEASRAAGVKRIVMLSFLRARPDGPTTYHRSKWAAEELVRGSGLTYTILKAGVIHGRGDHMLDHLSHAFHTFPVFALVGLHDRPVRPVAVDDVARILEAAALGDRRLADSTLAVLGPELLSLGEAVRRVARVTDRRPLFIRLPIGAHLAIARLAELTMRVPLISSAQVHILSEGVVESAPFADQPPDDLMPMTPFSHEVIRAGLPERGGFGCRDLRWGGA